MKKKWNGCEGLTEDRGKFICPNAPAWRVVTDYMDYPVCDDCKGDRDRAIVQYPIAAKAAAAANRRVVPLGS